MNKPAWNRIEFDRWERGGISVDTNHFGEDPIILAIEGNGYDSYDLDEWMTPAEARELAQKLVDAADAVDRAGAFTNGEHDHG